MKQLRNKLFILRFDDICPTMRWETWREIESALIRYNIKPILAVVPDNRDPGLQVAPAVADFWQQVRRWQELGWTIAMHGYHHLYVAPDGGLVTLRKKSEFASLPAAIQMEKLLRGSEIFAREGIKSRVWIAPGNSFDKVTVSLLPQFGIDIISAGWFWKPFVGPHKMTWLPCQLSILRPVPEGVWTVCYHPNTWDHSEYLDFFRSLERYRDDIVSMEEALSFVPPTRAKWCYHFCTSPRLSSFVMRADLKLWKMRHPERSEPNPSQSSESESWPTSTPMMGSGPVH